MLVPASQTSPVLSRRSLLRLGAAGVLTCVLANFPSAPAAAQQEEPATEGGKVLPGKIFLDALLKIKPEADGQIADVPREVCAIIAVDPDSGRWEKTVDDAYCVRVSPDGKVLAFLRLQRSSKPHSLCETWTYDLTTRTATRVLDDGASLFSSSDVGEAAKYRLSAGHPLCWSPDGRQIIGSTARSRVDDGRRKQFVVRRVNLDGSGVTRVPVPDTDEVNDWSGDGKWFVTVSARHAHLERFGFDLYRMHPDGTEQLRLTKGGHNCYPRFSPDGRRIVYFHRDRETPDSLRVMDVDGTNDREVLREEGLTGVVGSCFSPDGRRLAVVRSNQQIQDGAKVYREGEGSFHLEIMDPDGKNRRELRLAEAKILWLGFPDWR